jgi:hypothetical protein
MRTFSRDQWTEAQAAWDDGHFSDEWKAIRHQAAMRGILYPPDGDRFDSWEDDEPSQRAMLIRAIRETPSLLSAAVSRSKSWGEVIAYVIRRRDEWRDELNAKERDREHRAEPERRSEVLSIKAILNRIWDS